MYKKILTVILMFLTISVVNAQMDIQDMPGYDKLDSRFLDIEHDIDLIEEDIILLNDSVVKLQENVSKINEDLAYFENLSDEEKSTYYITKDIKQIKTNLTVVNSHVTEISQSILTINQNIEHINTKIYYLEILLAFYIPISLISIGICCKFCFNYFRKSTNIINNEGNIEQKKQNKP